MGKSKRKKMGCEEMKGWLEVNKRNANGRELNEIAELNNETVNEFIERLEIQCYHLDYLGITRMRRLRKDIKTMQPHELEMVERINEMSIQKVKEELDKMIPELVRERKINKEIEVLKKEKDLEIFSQMYIEGKYMNFIELLIFKSEAYDQIEKKVLEKYGVQKNK